MSCIVFEAKQLPGLVWDFFRKNSCFFWRNNDVLDFFTAEITSLGLLRQQAQAPHYFLRCLLISSEMKEAPHYFFRKKWGTSLFLQKKMKCLIISSEKNEASISSEKNEIPHHFYKKNEAHHYFKKKAPHYFFRKKWDASLFLQKKMKCLIISSGMNLDFFRKK